MLKKFLLKGYTYILQIRKKERKKERNMFIGQAFTEIQLKCIHCYLELHNM